MVSSADGPERAEHGDGSVTIRELAVYWEAQHTASLWPLLMSAIRDRSGITLEFIDLIKPDQHEEWRRLNDDPEGSAR